MCTASENVGTAELRRNFLAILDSKQVCGLQPSGIIVNTMGWTEDLGFELLLHSLQALKVGLSLTAKHFVCLIIQPALRDALTLFAI
jgi:mRNA cleavage and polyadenylation factor CLP1 P-loop